jgi:uncharacterized protein (TIGR02145 family)/uncharacterized repeat protein (TIGR02543 family)
MKRSILMITLAVITALLFVTCNDRGTDVNSDRWDGKVDNFLRTFGGTTQVPTPDATYKLSTTVSPLDGGSVYLSPNKETYAAGEAVTVTATPYNHYTFIGWSGASSSTSETVSITMNGDKELIANFTSKKYTLTTGVSVDGSGTVTRNPEKDAYTAGDTVTVTATAAPNYTFNGWSGASPSTDATVKIVMDGPKALTADFGKNGASRFTVYFNRNSATGNAAESTTADSGSSITLPDQQAMENAGYQFGGWNTNSTGTGTNYPAKSSYTVTQNDITLYAKWVPVRTITFNPMGGTVAPTSGTTDTTGNLTTSPPTPTRNGYRFDGWFTTETAGGTLVTTGYTFNNDAIIYARWTIVTYTVTWNVDGGLPIPTQKTVNHGENITAPAAMTKTGYTFNGWYTNSNFTTPVSFPIINVTENKTFYAKWTVATGTFTDSRRGGKTYKWVEIDGKRWMAENLNYDTTGSWCYDNNPDNCVKYGRLYNWNTAMAGSRSSTASPSGVRGVCPAGWHLPSRREWGDLAIVAGATPANSNDEWGGGGPAGTKLKAKKGWNNRSNGDSGNGTDEYGFSALPGGRRGADGSFGRVGDFGDWWTATEGNDVLDAYFRSMQYDVDGVFETFLQKGRGFSVRCRAD